MIKYKLSKVSYDNLSGVSPDIIAEIEAAIAISPIDFGIPKDGGFRTDKRQNELYLDPNVATKCDGYKIKSKHQSGMAFDVFAYVGAASWEKHHLAMVAGAILASNQSRIDRGLTNIKLTWGGSFGSKSFDGWDAPHFEGERIA